MECPHLVSEKILPGTRVERPFKCSKCDLSTSLWLCVSCGSVNCGRYASAHGLSHFSENPSHSVVMESSELSLFCYLCDDFIINECPRLLSLREALRAPASSSTGKKVLHDLRPRRRSSVKRELDKEVSENKPKRLKKEEEKPQMITTKKKLVGLRNLGNTCFMSAVLQSLSNIQEFCRVLKQLPTLDSQSPSSSPRELRRSSSKSNGLSSKEGPIMTKELKKVLLALNNTESKKAISPEALFMVIWKVVPRFRGYQQQDAHEFLRYMLDRLHTELLPLLPSDLSRYNPCLSSTVYSSNSLVTAIFGGMLQSEVNCLDCKASSKKHDPFLDLSIDIPSRFTNLTSRKAKNYAQQQIQLTGGGNKETHNATCHLHDCLQKFVDVEELADSERFFCGSCKNKQRSTKKFWIRRLPNVLCLHIKRFRWSPYSRTKLDTHVAFPLSGLDMSDYLLSNLHETRCSNSGSSLYDLAAVIVHHGSGAGSGHYTAFVTKNNHWYHFNDSTVLASDPETVLKSKAYILFYIQREFRQPGFNSNSSSVGRGGGSTKS
eukprot:TRINITY_DN3185_c0_g1_i1.p1 TRINITY_DN3185_c0_g1~~TRINITY_DN3185_c0_g1_i1.p1  ORF type:complete len:547 (-),score=156.85 TRINITY_DN3185_c0_g1_i1:247-1887(-)